MRANKIKAAGGKRQRRAIRAHPGNIRCFSPSLSRHAERSVEAGVPGTPRREAVGDQLISSAATDVQNRQIREFALSGKRQELPIGLARAIRLRIVKIGNLVVIYSCEATRQGSAGAL